MPNMFGFIYKITNKINNRIYIGQSHLTEDVFHSKYWGSGKIIKLAIRKNGKENFTKEILQYCNSQQELDEAEKEWILKLDTLNKEKGYNLAKGGWQVPFFDGAHHTELTKIKISQASKKDWLTNPNKQNSLEALKKVWKKNTGVPRKPEHIEAVKQALAELAITDEYRALKSAIGKKGAEARKQAGGYKPYNKDSETLIKMSEAALAQHARMTPEEKEHRDKKISESLKAKGLKRTDEQKAATAAGRKKWIAEHPEEFKAAMAKCDRKGKKLPGKLYEIYNSDTGDVVITIQKLADFRKEYKYSVSYIYARLDENKPFDDRYPEHSGLCIRTVKK